MKCDKERFLRDVKDHKLTVLKDDGLYRHLRFAKPDTRCMSFDLVTWPGYLCYCGDMGDYTFARLDDMFQFFRSKSGELQINEHYWAEKCEARDRDGIEEFSPELFEQAILDEMKDCEFPEDVIEAVRSDVIAFRHDGEEVAVRRALEFDYNGYSFPDFYENRLRDYTYRFIFCCYAIAWGIQQYDAVLMEENLEESQ